jgi:hypothetical protein
MASAFLTSVTDDRKDAQEVHLFPVRHVRACAALDRHRRHQVVTDPARADVILFVEGHGDDAVGPYFGEVRGSPLFRRYQDRCFLHSGVDHVIPFLPGIYPSIEKRWSWSGWARGGCYLVAKNPFIEELATAALEKVHLASFRGVFGDWDARHRLAALAAHPGFEVRDTTQAFLGAIRGGDDAALADLKRAYVRACRESKFVLCPRGRGPSSIRIFEAMELGVAPVVIADDWVEPAGPRWADISLRVAERDIARLPEILAARAPDHERLGRPGRRARG